MKAELQVEARARSVTELTVKLFAGAFEPPRHSSTRRASRLMRTRSVGVSPTEGRASPS